MPPPWPDREHLIWGWENTWKMPLRTSTSARDFPWIPTLLNTTYSSSITNWAKSDKFREIYPAWSAILMATCFWSAQTWPWWTVLQRTQWISNSWCVLLPLSSHAWKTVTTIGLSDKLLLLCTSQALFIEKRLGWTVSMHSHINGSEEHILYIIVLYYIILDILLY